MRFSSTLSGLRSLNITMPRSLAMASAFLSNSAMRSLRSEGSKCVEGSGSLAGLKASLGGKSRSKRSPANENDTARSPGGGSRAKRRLRFLYTFSGIDTPKRFSPGSDILALKAMVWPLTL